MKRKTVATLFLILIASLSLYASPAFGYGFAPVGEASPQTKESFSGVEVYLNLRFTEKHYGDVEAYVLSSFQDPYFRGAGVTVSSPLYVTLDHSFNRFFTNPVYWEPTVKLGCIYREGKKAGALLGLSPFYFASKHFSYEFFSPYVTLHAAADYGWGLTIMKFTAYLGGNR